MANGDVELAAEAALERIGPPGHFDRLRFFAQTSAKLSAPVIAAVLSRAERLTPREDWAVFLLGAVDREADDAALERQWTEAMQAFLALQVPLDQHGYKQHRAKLAALARQPGFLAAIQAAVVGTKAPMTEMLWVLAADGTEASVDALVPHFAQARDDDGTLDRLESLRRIAAPSPEMQGFLASVGARIERRNAASPALALARRLGFSGPTFRAEARLVSAELNANGVWRIQGEVSIDSRSSRWFSVHFVDLGQHGARLAFDQSGPGRDDLGLGHCTLDELPAWLERVRKHLGVHWERHASVNRASRGKNVERFLTWLFGA